MKNLLIFSVVIAFLIGCQQHSTYQPLAKEKAADEVIQRASLQIQKETGLVPCGNGGQMMNQIKMLNLSFNCYKKIEIEEARKLLIEAVNRFTTIINSDKKIRPYLAKYPFEPKNVEIVIYIYNPNGSNSTPGELAIAEESDGKLCYQVDIPKTLHLKTVLTETFQEALQKEATTRLFQQTKLDFGQGD